MVSSLAGHVQGLVPCFGQCHKISGNKFEMKRRTLPCFGRDDHGTNKSPSSIP